MYHHHYDLYMLHCDNINTNINVQNGKKKKSIREEHLIQGWMNGYQCISANIRFNEMYVEEMSLLYTYMHIHGN